MQLFIARQERKQMTEQTEKDYFTEPHHTMHRFNKRFDVHFNSSPVFKAYIYKLIKSIVMSF